MRFSVAVPEANPDRPASSPSFLASALAYALKKRSRCNLKQQAPFSETK
jgi:hypothetical protein